MTYGQATLLGVIQGASEFLPISSSAHLALAPLFFRFPDPGLAFDLALHLGTLLAVLLYYRRTWTRLILGACRDVRGAEARTLGLLAMATIPAVVAGLCLEKAADTLFRDPRRIGACLIAFSAVMVWAESRGANPGEDWRTSGPRTIFLIG
ncbi:MAG: undecaprenyl-diphosphate phosphatase, partial [Elusimicrobia bacterium]|nr:undecaprenyl-diphosphate phosphatase [Elusimicrobiota bacterium]